MLDFTVRPLSPNSLSPTIREATAMEPVLTTCDGCGKAIRVRRPESARRFTRFVCRACRAAAAPRPGGPDAAPPPSRTVATPPKPPPDLSRRGRYLTAPRGLLRVALLLLLATHLAIWSISAQNTTEPSPFGSPVTVSLRSPADPSAVPAASNDADTASNDDPERLNPLPLLSELARSKAAARLASLLREIVEPAPERSGASSVSAAAEVAPVLTPPDFGTPSSEALLSKFAAECERRFLIRDEEGEQVVARLHGHHDDKTVLMLPDGRLGIPSMLVPTDEPFRPKTADEVAKGLQTGPFEDFSVHRTPHYLILHQATPDFAKTNGELLEELYARLLEAFREHGVTVHEAEFPLVAVIFRTESDFREHRSVASDVQAYYEIFSNRIFFYQTSDREGLEPEVGALLKPQIVAHEGTHQILQNIGVQPRLAAWPLWLIEGLAEYCATPASSRKGPPTWDGLGQINNLHMATLRELEDPLSLSMQGLARSETLFRRPGQPLVEAMLTRSELTPTEYALAWAMTHYLALKRGDDFVDYLKRMADLPPLVPRTADDQVRDFRECFGDDLARLDKAIDAYLRGLTKQKGYAAMPYYAVMFEQPLTTGLVRRAAMVSQSPQLIRQWVQELSNPNAGPVTWQALPHSSRARANLIVQQWIRNR